MKIDNELLIEVAKYYVKNESTIRKTAKTFNISKSTVQIYLTKKLPNIKPKLAKKVNKIMRKNEQEKAKRGGIATREKYKKKP